MRVHEDVEAIVFGYSEHLNRVLDPFLIVDARTSCLNGLPCEDIADAVVAVSLQPREVKACLVLGEWSGVELDIIAVKEVVVDMGRLVGFAWVFGVAGDIDATENNLASDTVTKLAILNLQTKRRHCYPYSEISSQFVLKKAGDVTVEMERRRDQLGVQVAWLQGRLNCSSMTSLAGKCEQGTVLVSQQHNTFRYKGRGLRKFKTRNTLETGFIDICKDIYIHSLFKGLHTSYCQIGLLSVSYPSHRSCRRKLLLALESPDQCDARPYTCTATARAAGGTDLDRLPNPKISQFVSQMASSPHAKHHRQNFARDSRH